MTVRLNIVIATFCPILFLSAAASCARPMVASLTPLEIVAKSSQQMQALNSYHFVLDHVGGGTPIGMGVEMKKAVGDIVRPDKLKATLSGTALGMSLEVQLVSVGGTMLMTNPITGKWESPPSQFNVLNLFDPNVGIAAIMKGIANVTRLDDGDSSGVTSFHLKGSVRSDDLSSITGSSVKGTSVDVEVWIGKEDLLLRNVKLAGKLTEAEGQGIVRTLNLSSFNEAVSIEFPK